MTVSWVRISRRLLRLTEWPAIRSTPTAWPSCPQVTKTTAPQLVPMATCQQESMTISRTKCEVGAKSEEEEEKEEVRTHRQTP